MKKISKHPNHNKDTSQFYRFQINHKILPKINTKKKIKSNSKSALKTHKFLMSKTAPIFGNLEHRQKKTVKIRIYRFTGVAHISQQ
jgi:hypothetical protein